MTSLSIFSEPFARTGNISAEGFRKLLGRPALGVLQTVLREAIQNSMDAAKNGRGPDIRLRLRTLTESQHQVLREKIFGSLPANGQSSVLISGLLSGKRLRVFEIADFNTTGLAGPTRADAPSDDFEDPDFVNFMRNVGAARDTHHGGGTYGYGKTSLYSMSEVSTILVDSETTSAGQPVRRLMGCHLGSAFDAQTGTGDRRRFTGRHWWGIPDEDEGVEPAQEAAAVQLAEELGMPYRERGNTGTTVMVLDPFLSSDDLSVVQKELVETVLWNFWPRMTESTPENRRLRVGIEIEGLRVPVPRPEDFPPLDLYAEAMSDHRTKSEHLMGIRSQRPSKQLGHLSIRKGMRAERSGNTSAEGSLIPEYSSHIALMRPVELVVRYIEGEAFPDRRFEWAGVFICSDADDIEQAFASAEPPAHDDWAPQNLPKGYAKTYVNVALNKLNEIARTYVTPRGETGSGGERGPSLAGTATMLGRLLDAVSTQGPGRKTGERKGTSKRRLTAISQPEFVRLSLGDNGEPRAEFEATLTNDGSDPSLSVVAEPHLVADGGVTGAEDLPPEFAVTAASVELEGEGLVSIGDRLEVGQRGGRLRIAVQMPAAAAVGLRLRLQGGAGS
ncbi:hypothetical protein [Ruegeria sp. HKCCA5763]|uniref:hypothetical protein n=1 Tax=Ruegeria sp. HKCCA5763 TaxID=2682987 RepID=UPI00148945F6|nr:hypothetical protein [Ruegeria sp. HKCCA5763]